MVNIPTVSQFSPNHSIYGENKKVEAFAREFEFMLVNEMMKNVDQYNTDNNMYNSWLSEEYTRIIAPKTGIADAIISKIEQDK